MINEELLDRIILEEISNTNTNDIDFFFFVKLFNKIYKPSQIGSINLGNTSLSVLDDTRRIPIYLSISNNGKDIFKALIEKGGLYKRIVSNEAVFCENFILTDFGAIICEPNILESVYKEIRSYIKEEVKVPTINMIAYNNQGNIGTIPVKITKYEDDLNLNYNDDLPDETINKILRDSRSSINILYGSPGTGKTSYLRRLIANNDDLNFYWMDPKLINGMTSADFLSFIIDNRNAIYILEDCEHLLVKRDDGNNNLLSAILNISDGMIGDSLNVKFICTFNTNLTNIDPAVLRKGRLRIKYEFKNLESDKVKALAEHFGINIPDIKPMPLCDVYNYTEDNGTNKEEPKKIGF